MSAVLPSATHVSICDRLCRRLARTMAVMILGVLAVLPLKGCDQVAAIAYVVEGPPTVDPLYKLPKEKVVVFVDDRASIIMRSTLRREIAETVTEEIVLNQKLVAGGIHPDAATNVAMSEAVDNLLPIDEIGREAGADVLIYVEPLRFTLVQDGMPRPFAQYVVKVIDCETGARLWPEDEMGHPVPVMMNYKVGSYYEDGNRELLERQLAQFSGLRIAQLFYEHEPNPLDGELNP